MGQQTSNGANSRAQDILSCWDVFAQPYPANSSKHSLTSGLPWRLNKGTSRVFAKEVADLKEQEKFRVQYMRRLCDEKVWIPGQERPPQHQSVIIFDWDDTLMYTSFLQACGCNLAFVSPATQRHLASIESSVCALLEVATSLGQTFIITNAEKFWVEECVRLYMPSVAPILAKVTVVSARDEHEAESCGDVSQWKRLAFSKLGQALDSHIVTNLVSIGDSNFELEAAHLLAKSFALKFVKTVKFQERPSAEELSKELSLLAPKIQSLIQKASNMKVQLTKKQN